MIHFNTATASGIPDTGPYIYPMTGMLAMIWNQRITFLSVDAFMSYTLFSTCRQDLACPQASADINRSNKFFLLLFYFKFRVQI